MDCGKRDPMYRLSRRFLLGLGKEAKVRAVSTATAQHLQDNTGRDIAIAAPLSSDKAKGLSIRPENLNKPEQQP